MQNIRHFGLGREGIRGGRWGGIYVLRGCVRGWEGVNGSGRVEVGRAAFGGAGCLFVTVVLCLPRVCVLVLCV